MADRRDKLLQTVYERRARRILPEPYATTQQDKELLHRLGTLQDYAMPYDKAPYGELFIHWYYLDRSHERLSLCEIYHLNMLTYYNVVNRVEVIHIRCAVSHGCTTPAMEQAIAILSRGKARVDFKCVEQKPSWEHDTIKEAAEYAIKSGKFVYYTHFKGVSRVPDPLFATSPRSTVYGELDVYYWCWLLYGGLFTSPTNVSAIGPMLRNGINKSYSYTTKAYDVSWSALHKELHHYVGSFQAFDGKALLKRCNELGIGDIVTRNKKLWVNDPYTVEMFLSLIFPTKDVYTKYVLGSLPSYKLYVCSVLPYHKSMFTRLYTEDTPCTPLKIECSKAVITYLYGEHKLLRDPLVVDPSVAYVCITDDPTFTAPTGSPWQVIHDPWEAFPGRFKHMNAKFRPFRYVTASKAIVLDSSIQITGSLLDLFNLQNNGVLLKQHSVVATIGEELPRWSRLRGMPPADIARFKSLLPLIGASEASRIYGGDVSVWMNTPRAIHFGESVLSLVECAGSNQPFMSNQLCISALAAYWFSDIAGVLPRDGLPMRKYGHCSWEEISIWR